MNDGVIGIVFSLVYVSLKDLEWWVQTVKQSANNQETQGYTLIDTEKFMACLEERVISV